MGRIRTIKPELFTHEGLFDLEAKTQLPVRLAFAGLFTCCDREGRFEWRPRRLKAAIMPYDDIDFTAILSALRDSGFIVQYDASGTCAPRVTDATATREARENGLVYGCIPTWKKHQHINNRESPSELPPPTSESVDAANNQLDLNIFDASRTRATRDEHADFDMHVHAPAEGEREGEGEREVECISSLIDSGKGRGASESAAVSIPLNDKSEFQIPAKQVQQWQDLYPAIDVLDELVRFRQWSIDHPKKRKTRRGVMTSITRWLSEEQDKGGRRSREASVGTTTKAATPEPPRDEIPAGLDAARGKKLWHKALDHLETVVNRHTFDTWVKPSRGLGMNGTVLYVGVPGPEFRDMLKRHLSHALSALKDDGVEIVEVLRV